MSDRETGILVRKAKVPERCRPIPLYLDGPLDCEWVGIIMYKGTTECELVFYDTNGEPREWLFRESIKIALQEGTNITACKSLRWQVCHIAGIADDQMLKWADVVGL